MTIKTTMAWLLTAAVLLSLSGQGHTRERQAGTPPAPDYAVLASWAAHPDKKDPADLVPPGSDAQDRQGNAKVDVFYLHPTTYYKKDFFNVPYDHPESVSITNTGAIALQASSFNGAGKVFAPYYRQMSLPGYFTAYSQLGLELAYTDVERAFDYWLEHWNRGRPFILAGHSQGTHHAQTLLLKRFSGEQGRALRERLVAAYLVGGWIVREPPNSSAPLPTCTGASDTGCIIGWRTISENANPWQYGVIPTQTNLCVNPLSWRQDGGPAPASANLGALPLGQKDLPMPAASPGKVGARCVGGWLRIRPTPTGKDWNVAVKGGDYHVYDFALFYMNIRENARERAQAYLAKRPK